MAYNFAAMACEVRALSTTGVVSTAGKPCLVYGIVLKSGTTASSLTLKNGGTGGSAIMVFTTAGTTAAGDVMESVIFPKPVIFSTDCYGTLAGTNASAIVFYNE